MFPSGRSSGFRYPAPFEGPACREPRLDCPSSGGVAEWLGRGLQSLAHRFDSGPRLVARYDEGSGA